MATESCRDLLGQLSDYVDGDLDQDLCRALEAHMAGCDNCRTVVDTLSETVHLFHALPPATVSATISARFYFAGWPHTQVSCQRQLPPLMKVRDPGAVHSPSPAAAMIRPFRDPYFPAVHRLHML